MKYVSPMTADKRSNSVKTNARGGRAGYRHAEYGWSRSRPSDTPPARRPIGIPDCSVRLGSTGRHRTFDQLRIQSTSDQARQYRKAADTRGRGPGSIRRLNSKIT